jgi:diguanylate cyclase (GGDEF)-like protein/PAS domain S-box-containing protein
VALPSMIAATRRPWGGLLCQATPQGPRGRAMTLAVGLGGLCLAAGPLLLGTVFGDQGILAEHPWLVALASVVGVSLLIGIGCVLLRRYRVRDIAIERLERERRQLINSEDRFRSLVLNTSDVIITVTAEGAIEYHSPSAERIWGYPPDVLNHAPVLELVHPKDQEIACSLFEEALARPRLGIAAELRIRLADSSWRHFDVVATNLLRDPRVGGIVVTFRDITERKQFEETLSYQASHDALTDLPNRTLFREGVERALERARRQGSPLAVMFLDVDNFKVVNDSLGHAVGDQLLIQVAERIQRCLRHEDTLARLSGDEFAILVEDAGGADEAYALGRRIQDHMKTPFSMDDQEVFTSVSVGIVMNGPGHQTPNDLLRDADLAMYHAKMNGKACCELFDQTMNSPASERLHLETSLHRALERAELRVFYQPIVDIVSGDVAGFEALVRWAHPQRGLIPPGEFIPLAEETGLIVPLDAWVLQEACRQFQEWQARHSRPLLLSVNISARQLQSPSLIQTVANAIESTGLDPRYLKLELTESVMIGDVDLVRERLRELKKLSIQIAIDDFGTGFSSLAYLRDLPINCVKLDRSFIARLGTDPRDNAIVRSIVTLAHDLGLTVVGEGIELAEQLAALNELGCDFGQGFYFSAGVPADVAGGLLSTGLIAVRGAAASPALVRAPCSTFANEL